jgi:hypothetical protein
MSRPQSNQQVQLVHGVDIHSMKWRYRTCPQHQHSAVNIQRTRPPSCAFCMCPMSRESIAVMYLTKTRSNETFEAVVNSCFDHEPSASPNEEFAKKIFAEFYEHAGSNYGFDQTQLQGTFWNILNQAQNWKTKMTPLMYLNATETSSFKQIYNLDVRLAQMKTIFNQIQIPSSLNDLQLLLKFIIPIPAKVVEIMVARENNYQQNGGGKPNLRLGIFETMMLLIDASSNLVTMWYFQKETRMNLVQRNELKTTWWETVCLILVMQEMILGRHVDLSKKDLWMPKAASSWFTRKNTYQGAKTIVLLLALIGGASVAYSRISMYMNDGIVLNTAPNLMNESSYHPSINNTQEFKSQYAGQPPPPSIPMLEGLLMTNKDQNQETAVYGLNSVLPQTLQPSVKADIVRFVSLLQKVAYYNDPNNALFDPAVLLHLKKIENNAVLKNMQEWKELFSITRVLLRSSDKTPADANTYYFYTQFIRGSAPMTTKHSTEAFVPTTEAERSIKWQINVDRMGRPWYSPADQKIRDAWFRQDKDAFGDLQWVPVDAKKFSRLLQDMIDHPDTSWEQRLIKAHWLHHVHTGAAKMDGITVDSGRDLLEMAQNQQNKQNVTGGLNIHLDNPATEVAKTSAGFFGAVLSFAGKLNPFSNALILFNSRDGHQRPQPDSTGQYSVNSDRIKPILHYGALVNELAVVLETDVVERKGLFASIYNYITSDAPKHTNATRVDVPLLLHAVLPFMEAREQPVHPDRIQPGNTTDDSDPVVITTDRDHPGFYNQLTGPHIDARMRAGAYIKAIVIDSDFVPYM